MHAAQFGDASFTDQDATEKRGVIHHRLCLFLSDVLDIDEVLSVRSMFFGKTSVEPRSANFSAFVRRVFSSCFYCTCLETSHAADKMDI